MLEQAVEKVELVSDEAALLQSQQDLFPIQTQNNITTHNNHSQLDPDIFKKKLNLVIGKVEALLEDQA